MIVRQKPVESPRGRETYRNLSVFYFSDKHMLEAGAVDRLSVSAVQGEPGLMQKVLRGDNVSTRQRGGREGGGGRAKGGAMEHRNASPVALR